MIATIDGDLQEDPSDLNPMAGLIEGFRAAFLGRPFDLTGIGISLTVAALLFLLGISYFEKMERRFADVI